MKGFPEVLALAAVALAIWQDLGGQVDGRTGRGGDFPGRICRAGVDHHDLIHQAVDANKRIADGGNDEADRVRLVECGDADGDAL